MAVIRKKLRMEYFEVTCRRNDAAPAERDTLFDMENWIDVIDEKPLSDRTLDFFSDKIRLEREYYKDEGFWFMSFLRLRETNIPKTAKINEEARDMTLDEDEYIGEEANAIYCVDNRILMLQRNVHSLSYTAIETYLNNFWENRNGLTIYLRPIADIDRLTERVMRNSLYRTISIRFADVRQNRQINFRSQGLTNLLNGFSRFQPLNCEFKMSISRDRADQLDRNEINQTINDIRDNRDVITKAELSLKPSEDEPVNIIDMFSDRIHDFINITQEARQSLATEELADLMWEKYCDSRARILNAIDH